MDSDSRAAHEACAIGVMYRRFKSHVLMVIVHTCYTLLYFTTEAAFNNGLNPHVMVTYRHFIGGFVMLPFAYVLERNVRPKMTLALFAEIFVLSLFGSGLSLNMYFASLKYTSPTFLASMINTIASLTFVMAIILRMEQLDVRNPRGLAKIFGTLCSLAGVMIMTSCKGPVIRNLGKPLIHIARNNLHENWTKGSILTVASCLTWSAWYIMQAFTMKKYPAPLSITTWMNFLGGTQSAVFAVIIKHKPEPWLLTVNIQLWSTIYSGVVCSGVIIFVLLWCNNEKGPVFVTMFNPLSTIMVAFTAYFVLGEKLYMGSILGAVVAIVGLYLLLWGKEMDKQEVGLKSQELPNLTSDEKQKEPTP